MGFLNSCNEISQQGHREFAMTIHPKNVDAKLLLHLQNTTPLAECRDLDNRTRTLAMCRDADVDMLGTSH
jgi:hypothetical protein